MIGLLFIGTIAIWAVVALALGSKIPLWLGLKQHGVALGFAFALLLFVAPVADEIIAWPQMQLLCSNLPPLSLADDLREHRHEGAWRIAAVQRDVAMRIILFLKSDREYAWPRVPGWYRVTRPLIWLLTLGFGSSALDRQFEFRDIQNVWPFRSSEEVQGAKNDPKYLAAAA